MVSEPRGLVLVQHNWKWDGKGIGPYSTVGIELVGSVLLGMFAGQWLDERFKTGSVMTFIGFGFGLAAGARAVWRALQRANRQAEKMDQEEREARRNFNDRKQ